MLQKLRSNRSVLSVGPMGTWTWTGPIGPRDQDGPDQSVLEIPLDRVEPILSVRLDSVQNRSVSVGLGPVQTEVVHTCPKPYAVREMAEAIRTRRVIGVNDASITRVSYDAIGEQWVKRFMNRHPELESLIAEQIEAARIQETSRPVLEKWFDDVKSIIDEYNIQPRDIYNMDETGFSIGSIKATRVIVDRTQNIRYSAYPGRQWVSAIECISMDSTALPPLIIFKGKTLSS